MYCKFGNRTHAKFGVWFGSIAELNRTQTMDWVRLSSIFDRSINYTGNNLSKAGTALVNTISSIKQIDSMLPCVYSVTDQKTSKCGKTICDTLGYRLACHVFVIIITFLTPSVICYWTDAWQQGYTVANDVSLQRNTPLLLRNDRHAFVEDIIFNRIAILVKLSRNSAVSRGKSNIRLDF